MAAIQRQAALYVTHGGGPMPVIGNAQKGITDFLRSVQKLLPQKPRAVVCVTAHWETDGHVTVSTSAKPPMLYDYGGFPPEAYQLQYPAPGDPKLASQVMDLIRKAGLPVASDNRRGYDHGTFVPLMLMLPEADVPVVQVSVMSNLDPGVHLALGRALEPLRDDNVLILGSGSSFHNMGLFRSGFFGGAANRQGVEAAEAFDAYLRQACCESSPEERARLLERWADAPGGRVAHPREEHLITLHVVAGAAGTDPGAQVMRDKGLSGYVCSSFLFNSAPAAAA